MTRRRLWWAPLLASLALLALAGCGSQGYASGLGKPATLALATSGGQSLGSATFTPFYAAHIATYYKGTQTLYASAQTPVELRQDTCVGKTLAALTAATAAPAPTDLVVAPDPKSGVDVSIAPSANLFVVVRQQANDANAPLLACGNPLSGRKQFFNLYTPGEGSDGYSLGIALMEPIVATRVNVALATPATMPTNWAVRSGSCAATPLAQGQITAGAKDASGVIFSALDTGQWRLTLSTDGGQTTCAQVS